MLRVLELFAGIGACSKALTNLGVEHEIVDAVEIDKYAKHRHNFDAYLETMERFGYTNYYQVLDAKNYGVPQHRERVFTVSILGGGHFKFPEAIPLKRKLKDVLEKDVDEKYYLSEERLNVIYEWEKRQKENGRGFRFEVKNGESVGRAVTTSGDRPCSTNYVAIKTANTTGYDLAKDGDGVDLAYPDSETRRGRVGHGVAKTIPTSSSQGVLDGVRIRKLTPRECYRLMGFSDDDYEKASKEISNTQLYKTAGNSIVVDVLEAILKELLC